MARITVTKFVSYTTLRVSVLLHWFDALRWRHNGRDSVSNHQPHHCLLNRLFRRRSKKTSKLRATGLCVGNSPGTGEFPAQMASNAENVPIWWHHHGFVGNSYFFAFLFSTLQNNAQFPLPLQMVILLLMILQTDPDLLTINCKFFEKQSIGNGILFITLGQCMI